MATVPTSNASDNGLFQHHAPSFESIHKSFLQQDGLPFANVLTAEEIETVFAGHNNLFAGDDIYSTDLVLWAFLHQVLGDGKEAACRAAVSHAIAYCQEVGRSAPSGNTGDYCRARAKLDPDALAELVRRCGHRLEAAAPGDWLWRGRHAKLVDGTTLTLPDTPANQRAFPQPPGQAKGVGFPMARACAVLSLATGAILDLAIGPYRGKGAGETALLRQAVEGLRPGDVVVFDRYYCSFAMVAWLVARGVDVCVRLHRRRGAGLRRVADLGASDSLAVWPRTERPDWLTPEQHAELPESLTVRLVELQVTGADDRDDGEPMTVLTTMTDPPAYPAGAIGQLYGYRWNAELDIEQIKQTLNLDRLRCKSPHMVRNELWTTLLAYNLIRTVIATAARRHDKRPRQISFTGACQNVLAVCLLLAAGRCRNPAVTIASALERIAKEEVANRPGRIEPRVIKRRKHKYQMMTKPRAKYRKELAMSKVRY